MRISKEELGTELVGAAQKYLKNEYAPIIYSFYKSVPIIQNNAPIIKIYFHTNVLLSGVL